MNNSDKFFIYTKAACDLHYKEPHGLMVTWREKIYDAGAPRVTGSLHLCTFVQHSSTIFLLIGSSYKEVRIYSHTYKKGLTRTWKYVDIYSYQFKVYIMHIFQTTCRVGMFRFMHVLCTATKDRISFAVDRESQTVVTQCICLDKNALYIYTDGSWRIYVDQHTGSGGRFNVLA